MNAPIGVDADILDGFRKESTQLLQELSKIVEKIESSHDSFPSGCLTDFSQKIDRIMGTAKTIATMSPEHVGLKRIGDLAAVCKAVGYKAAEKKATNLLPLFAAFWTDAIEVIQNLIDALDDADKTNQIFNSFSSVLQSRLQWLAKKVR
ncbi:MAG: hypothetical protein A3K03_03155 [Bdellovibrionales bacterium RIFOXYD1_FULL_44_7]|nr:MAG: hypothetical protein A3K03_03155 [Bdellovibrionales bacterium RIFOXYD1_FULL_44_7]